MAVQNDSRVWYTVVFGERDLALAPLSFLSTIERGLFRLKFDQLFTV
jgi:hypothetical protein